MTAALDPANIVLPLVVISSPNPSSPSQLSPRIPAKIPLHHKIHLVSTHRCSFRWWSMKLTNRPESVTKDPNDDPFSLLKGRHTMKLPPLIQRFSWSESSQNTRRIRPEKSQSRCSDLIFLMVRTYRTFLRWWENPADVIDLYRHRGRQAEAWNPRQAGSGVQFHLNNPGVQTRPDNREKARPD